MLASGLHFGEAPRWHDGALWFSDFFDHAVKTVDLDGDVSRSRSQFADQPSGLGWLPDGRLLVVSMTDRAAAAPGRRRLVVHADLSSLATFHCNDMVVDAVGRAYVGNFGFDLDDALEIDGRSPTCSPTHDGATVARVDPDGTVHVAADDLMFPNGTVITPDGRTLIVAESFGSRLTAFDIADDGSLSNRRVWADLGRRVPDGICLDADGAVWVANPVAHECFRVAEGGEVVDVVETDHRASRACSAADRRTLFMLTSQFSLARISRLANVGARAEWVRTRRLF